MKYHILLKRNVLVQIFIEIKIKIEHIWEQFIFYESLIFSVRRVIMWSANTFSYGFGFGNCLFILCGRHGDQ